VVYKSHHLLDNKLTKARVLLDMVWAVKSDIQLRDGPGIYFLEGGVDFLLLKLHALQFLLFYSSLLLFFSGFGHLLEAGTHVHLLLERCLIGLRSIHIDFLFLLQKKKQPNVCKCDHDAFQRGGGNLLTNPGCLPQRCTNALLTETQVNSPLRDGQPAINPTQSGNIFFLITGY